jgi:alkyl hydroperoxide reductase subunit AhpF
MGRTVVEPVRVRVCFCPGVAGAVVAAGAAVVAGTTTCVAAALDDAGVAEVVPLLVHPATTIDTMSNAARHTVTNTHELRLVFMVFDHDIIPC